MAATKRERLEKLVSDMQASADLVDAKRAKGEDVEAVELDAIVKMSKDARSLKNEILDDAKAEAAEKDAGQALEDAKSFLGSLGINPDAKATDRIDRATPGDVARKTIADQFLGSAQYKQFLSKFPSGQIPDRASLNMDPVAFKTLLTGASATSAGAMVWSDRSGITDFGTFQRPLTFRDVITVGTTDSDTVDYARITGFTNAAAPVAEATNVSTGTKPESAITLAKVTATVKTIAHWIPATRRSLADAGQLRTLIDNFLRYGLEEELEDQMLTGDGTGENLPGITGVSGIQTHAKGADSLLDAYRKAKTKVRLGGRASANAYLLHPNDWQEVDLLQNGDGNYYFGGPMNQGQPRLWGLPVVESEGVPEGTAYVADFKTCVLWDREQAAITMSDSHSDFFIKNLVAVLAEMRAAFGVLRPASIVKITGI